MANPRPINLDLTASFADVVQPTPFGLYDNDPQFRHDADSMVRYVYAKLGGRILGVEITNREVYASLEEALLEYSATVNSYQAKSIIASLIGTPTGSLGQNAGKLPALSLDQVDRMADAYSSQALVGGSKTLHSASIDLVAGTQNYNLAEMLSGSGQIKQGQSIRLQELFHFSPTAQYLFYDANSAINYLNAEFKFESFTPETVFYMLPVWEDIMRFQEMKMSQKVRRSNFSWTIVGNTITVFPVPQAPVKMFFTYYVSGEDPYANSPGGVTTGFADIPFGNLVYSTINAMGQHWIRRFAFALAKEALGQVRSKIAEIPIPDQNLTLNGLELIAQAREEELYLREELKDLLESMTYSMLAKQEVDQADSLQKQLQRVPMLIYVGASLFAIFPEMFI